MLIRSLLAVAGLTIVWLFSARQLTLLIDRLTTVRVRSMPTQPMAHDSDRLRLGDWALTFYDRAMTPEIRIYDGLHKRVLIAVGERIFAVGSASSPDPGDEVSLTQERSLLSWPTPLEFNFMTGHAPSWKRNLYYRLDWKKRSGARLELVWRYEQWYYGGLGGWGGNMTREGATGLIRANLIAEPAEKAVVDYISRTRQWKPSEYRIESQGPSADGKSDVFAIIHLVDERGEMIEVQVVQVDRASGQVRT